MSERGYLEGIEMANTFNMLLSNYLIWSSSHQHYRLAVIRSRSICCTGTAIDTDAGDDCTAFICATFI